MFHHSWENHTIIPKNVFAEGSPTQILSQEQLNFYNENGYLVIKGLIDSASLYNFKERFTQIVSGLVEKGFMTIVKEPALAAKGAKGEDLINKLQDIHFDDIFSTYSEDPKLLDIVSQLIGDTITVVHSMLINKPPGTGRHPPHQDLYYFPFRPADKIVAAWTAIDHVDQDNGCLYVVPASHRRCDLVPHQYSADTNKAFYHGIADEDAAPEGQRLQLIMEPGDTALFHPLLIHGSGHNVSQKYRKAISCHFASGQCHYVPVRGTLQQTIADEIEKTIARKDLHLTLAEIFHYKNKLVRGVKSNL